MGMARLRRFRDGLDRGLVDMAMADLGHRRMLAAPHAGCPQHPDFRTQPRRQGRQQGLGALELAAQGIADPDREGRGRGLAFGDDVEMGIEGGDLIDLRHGDLHLLGQGREMAGGEMAIAVLEEMQELDQQIAVARPVAQQGMDLRPGLRLDLPALARRRRLAPARARVDQPLQRPIAVMPVSGRSPLKSLRHRILMFLARLSQGKAHRRRP